MIEIEQARKLLREAVDTQGEDFVYNLDGEQSCFYKPLEGPSLLGPDDPRYKTGCLVGVALNLAGETRHQDLRESVMSLHVYYPDMMSREAAVYFRVAQIAQDEGKTWGEAFKVAEDVLATRVIPDDIRTAFWGDEHLIAGFVFEPEEQEPEDG